MDNMEFTLRQELEAMGMDLGDEKIAKLCAFGHAMVKQNEVMNLTAITEDAAVAKLHLADSLTVAATEDLTGKTLIDVGCGAGFPGVPLAIACDGLQVTLLDSLTKRVNWLAEILPSLEIEGHCLAARAEEAVASRRERFDYATSRAVARLNILLELTAPFVKVGGAVLAMKGAAAEEELAECKNAIGKLGLKLEKVAQYQIDGASHRVIVLRKIKPTPPQYPRRYAKIKQAPL